MQRKLVRRGFDKPLHIYSCGAVGWHIEMDASSSRTLRSISSRMPLRRRVLPCGVVEGPVFVTLSRDERTGIATAHRDDHVGNSEHVGGPLLGPLASHVNPDFLHGCDSSRIQRIGGFAAARVCDRSTRSEMTEPGQRHLRSTGVVDAQEQHCRKNVGVHVVAHAHAQFVPLRGEPDLNARLPLDGGSDREHPLPDQVRRCNGVDSRGPSISGARPGQFGSDRLAEYRARGECRILVGRWRANGRVDRSLC
jgi:hypothetical protein